MSKHYKSPSHGVLIRSMLTFDPAFGHWFAGFVDGEGCFSIYKARGSWACQFSMRLRDDDLPILEEIRDTLGFGRITHHGAQRTSKPQAGWEVRSRLSCMGLVEVLDEYPLRAKKANDYQVWRQSVIHWNTPMSTNERREGFPQFHEALVCARSYPDTTSAMPTSV